jgi:hypothetical protein
MAKPSILYKAWIAMICERSMRKAVRQEDLNAENQDVISVFRA